MVRGARRLHILKVIFSLSDNGSDDLLASFFSGKEVSPPWKVRVEHSPAEGVDASSQVML